VALITAGLALKSALFPLHFWLPRAHASAPAPVSALLSALVVAATAYLVLRLWVEVFAPAHPVPRLCRWWARWGRAPSSGARAGDPAAAAEDHDRVLHRGAGGLPLPGRAAGLRRGRRRGCGPVALAWSGGVYHALSHAFAKAAMFLAAGSIIRALGSDRIVGISGIAAHLPVSTYAFGIAGMSLIGLPPSGGFVAKWLLLTASLASGQWWWGW
jgi:multicomponent Na+:H+ antiporter subunit D